MSKVFSFDETAVEEGGVLRCCLGSVGHEHRQTGARIGAMSHCEHCRQEFKLVRLTPGMKSAYRYKPGMAPIWKPTDQL